MEKEQNFTDQSHLRYISSTYYQVEDSYILVRITPGADCDGMPETLPAMKMDGLIFSLVRDGTMSIDCNGVVHEVNPNSLICLHPGATVVISSKEWQRMDAYILFLSKDFMRDINLNLMAFSTPAVIEERSPVMQLEIPEMKILFKYFDLLSSNASDNFNINLNKYIASSLSSAMFYQIMLLVSKRIEMYSHEKGSQRRRVYVHEFIKLVNANFTRERSVNFYAQKLFISPKYLSLLVKEVTGHSATKWIDDFVIMEAKNLLRFSGKNIQQVAYALNFSNQSAFGKYFKHLTGLSPTEYQKM